MELHCENVSAGTGDPEGHLDVPGSERSKVKHMVMRETSRRNDLLVTSVVVLVLSLVFESAVADDLTGIDRFVCAPAQINICDEYGSCATVMPWEVNVPRFLVFDLKKKQIGTTEASGENRVTPIQSVTKAEDAIYLQGVEGGRAFSFVISRSSGFMSAAIAREYLTVTGFGACTPAT